jgi:hypothetical protein
METLTTTIAIISSTAIGVMLVVAIIKAIIHYNKLRKL